MRARSRPAVGRSRIDNQGNQYLLNITRITLSIVIPIVQFFYKLKFIHFGAMSNDANTRVDNFIQVLCFEIP